MLKVVNMNKKSMISLKFLLNLILGIVIFGVFIGCTAKVYNLAFRTDPFYETISFIEEVSADEKVKFDYRMMNIPKGGGLIGFSEGAKKFEYWKDGKVKGSFPSQEACDNKNCLCLCEDFLSAGYDTAGIGSDYIKGCETAIKCHQFDNVKFADSVYLDEDKKEMWKGGFLIKSNAVYIRRFDGAISVCDTSKCTVK